MKSISDVESRRTAGLRTQPVSVRRELVYERTRALALRAGRVPPEVRQVDYEQAKRELTGESDPERQDAALDSPALR